MKDLIRKESSASSPTTIDDMVLYLDRVRAKYGNISIVGSVDGGYYAGNPDGLFVDTEGDDGVGVVVIGFA